MKSLFILPIVLTSSVCFSQNLPEDKTTKVLKYEILIKEENKKILKSNFEVKNGNEFVLLSKEIGIQDKNLNQKNGILNTEEVITTLEDTEKESGNIEQLKIIVNIGKDNNIFSEFSWKIVNLTNTKKMALLSQGNKALITETIPIVYNNDSKVLITHKINNETFFILDKKEFTIKAVY